MLGGGLYGSGLGLLGSFGGISPYSGLGGLGALGGLNALGGYGSLGAYSGLGGLSLYSGLGGLGTLGSLSAYSGLGGFSPFSLSNLFYPIQTSAGLSYQIPYLQLAPLLGVGGLYNQLFPSLFDPTATGTETTQ